VLAVRVLGSGGIWSVRRNRPPRAWVAEGAPRWWTVAVVNWEDEPWTCPCRSPRSASREPGSTPTTCGATPRHRSEGQPDAHPRTAQRTHHRAPSHRRPAAGGRHDASCRARSRGPHRRRLGRGHSHAEGDIHEPRWRRLRGHDCGPEGTTTGACKADVPCTVRRLQSGHAVLEWPAGGDGRDIRWELTFKSTTATRKAKARRSLLNAPYEVSLRHEVEDHQRYHGRHRGRHLVRPAQVVRALQFAMPTSSGCIPLERVATSGHTKLLH